MPAREQQETFGLADLINGIRWKHEQGAPSRAELAIIGLRPRAIYESQHFISGMHCQIVDGAVRFTLRRCSSDFPIRELLTNLCIDGFVLFRQREQETGPETPPIYVPGAYVPEEPENVECCTFRQGELVGVELEYEYFPDPPPTGPDGYMPAGRKPQETWVYWAQFDKIPSGGATYTEMRYPKGDPNSQRAIGPTAIHLDVFPYRGVQNINCRSIIEAVKLGIFRYEAVFRAIAGENDRHSARLKQYINVAEVTKEQAELKAQGYELIPAGGKGEYPDTHPEGIEPMFTEKAMIEDEIRDTVGLIRLMKLHNTSGPSREIEIIPTEALAYALREKCRDIQAIAYPDTRLHFGPLIDLSPQEKDIEINEWRDLAIEKVITGEEYVRVVRMLMDLPEVPDKVGPEAGTARGLQLLTPQKISMQQSG